MARQRILSDDILLHITYFCEDEDLCQWISVNRMFYSRALDAIYEYVTIRGFKYNPVKELEYLANMRQEHISRRIRIIALEFEQMGDDILIDEECAEEDPDDDVFQNWTERMLEHYWHHAHAIAETVKALSSVIDVHLFTNDVRLSSCYAFIAMALWETTGHALQCLSLCIPTCRLSALHLNQLTGNELFFLEIRLPHEQVHEFDYTLSSDAPAFEEIGNLVRRASERLVCLELSVDPGCSMDGGFSLNLPEQDVCPRLRHIDFRLCAEEGTEDEGYAILTDFIAVNCDTIESMTIAPCREDAGEEYDFDTFMRHALIFPHTFRGLTKFRTDIPYLEDYIDELHQFFERVAPTLKTLCLEGNAFDSSLLTVVFSPFAATEGSGKMALETLDIHFMALTPSEIITLASFFPGLKKLYLGCSSVELDYGGWGDFITDMRDPAVHQWRLRLCEFTVSYGLNEGEVMSEDAIVLLKEEVHNAFRECIPSLELMSVKIHS